MPARLEALRDHGARARGRGILRLVDGTDLDEAGMRARLALSTWGRASPQKSMSTGTRSSTQVSTSPPATNGNR
ncbi:MAG: hypothetical protein ABW298_11630, partial [Candidatus Binatia bacterium]